MIRISQKIAISVLTTALLLTPQARANNQSDTTQQPFACGPFVALGVGGQIHADDIEADEAGVKSSVETKRRSAMGQFQLGWGWRISQFYLGLFGEFLFGNSNSSVNFFNSTPDINVKNSHGLGAGLRLGWFPQPCSLLFVNVGAEGRRFEIKWDTIGTQDDVLTKYSLVAFKIGIGALIEVAKNWAIGIEVTTALYPRKNSSRGQTSLEHHPRRDTFLVSAHYNLSDILA